MKYIKRLWDDLTKEQQEEFIRQLKFARDHIESNYPTHLYQLREGNTVKEICQGWIINGKTLKK